MSESQLIDAVKSGELAKVEELLNSGSDIHQQDEQGWTPLNWAAGRGDLDMVKLLLDRGADVFRVGRDQRTPYKISLAARHMGGFFKYNTDIFEDITIAKMIKHFQTLIENLLADPHQHLSDSSFLTESETMGLSSADFPESGLSQKDFESLILQLNSSASLK